MSTATRPTRTADQRIADEVAVDHALMCSASGCPNRWSVDAGNGRACGAHAFASLHLWPQITAEQQDAETERALQAQLRRPAEPAPRPDPARLRAVLSRLRMGQAGGRTPAQRVAARLRGIAAAGPLNEAQKAVLAACEARNPAPFSDANDTGDER